MRVLRTILVLTIVLSIVLVPLIAFGQDSGGGGDEVSSARKIWDTVWRFVNFFVLAFIIYKFGRVPLLDFLQRHGKDIGDRMNATKIDLEEAETEFKATQAKLDQIEDQIAELKDYFHLEAEKAQERIISEAREMSEMILSDAKEQAAMGVKGARDKVKADLVDQIIEEVEGLIRRNLASEDHERMIKDYLAGIQPEPAS